ncbi:MAG: DNA adenine methylase [Dehalococcoidia bacterium]
MVQLSFYKDDSRLGIVNVASVPQRSPFRYPGGKTWLVPRIRQWLAIRGARPHVFIEPFTGGGIISLTVAFESLAERIIMVELDDQVASVWKTILGGHAKWLVERLLDFELTLESVEAELAKRTNGLKEKAFRTILRNRVSHGGILAPGSGLIKYGEDGKGIKSRWYPHTLAKRILNIEKVKHKITFVEGDGLEVIKKTANQLDVVYFIDPPYTAAGKRAGTRLYTHNKLDHEALFRLMRTVNGDFLMTYDYSEGVLNLAKRHDFDTCTIPMMNTHHAELTELLISRDLDWVRSTL